MRDISVTDLSGFSREHALRAPHRRTADGQTTNSLLYQQFFINHSSISLHPFLFSRTIFVRLSLLQTLFSCYSYFVHNIFKIISRVCTNFFINLLYNQFIIKERYTGCSASLANSYFYSLDISFLFFMTPSIEKPNGLPFGFFVYIFRCLRAQ